MAYFRGDHYIFDTGEHFHIWVHGHYDAWRHSVWAESYPDPDANAGVELPTDIMDRFVMMRLAELLVDQRAMPVLESMAPELAGPCNSGELQVKGNLSILKRAFADMQRACVRYRPEDFEGGRPT